MRKTFDGFDYTRPDPATGETIWTTPLGFRYQQEPAFYDDAGPDPGDTIALDLVEADQRWIPPLPDPPISGREPPDPPPLEPPF